MVCAVIFPSCTVAVGMFGIKCRNGFRSDNISAYGAGIYSYALCGFCRLNGHCTAVLCMCFKIHLFGTARAGVPMSCFVLGIIHGKAVSVAELWNSFRLCMMAYGASVGLYALCGFCCRNGYHSAVIAMRSNVRFTTAHGANVIVIIVIIAFPVRSVSVMSCDFQTFKSNFCYRLSVCEKLSAFALIMCLYSVCGAGFGNLCNKCKVVCVNMSERRS